MLAIISMLIMICYNRLCHAITSYILIRCNRTPLPGGRGGGAEEAQRLRVHTHTRAVGLRRGAAVHYIHYINAFYVITLSCSTLYTHYRAVGLRRGAAVTNTKQYKQGTTIDNHKETLIKLNIPKHNKSGPDQALARAGERGPPTPSSRHQTIVDYIIL